MAKKKSIFAIKGPLRSARKLAEKGKYDSMMPVEYVLLDLTEAKKYVDSALRKGEDEYGSKVEGVSTGALVSAVEYLKKASARLKNSDIPDKAKYKFSQTLLRYTGRANSALLKAYHGSQGLKSDDYRAIIDSGELYATLTDLERDSKWREKHPRQLESIAATASILATLTGIFFLAFNFSSNNIQLSPASSQPFNWQLYLGILLIIIGLVCGFFWFKKKK